MSAEQCQNKAAADRGTPCFPSVQWPGASSAPNICQSPSSRPHPAPAAQLWEQSLPQTTQRAPTGAHRPCSCRLSSPWAWPARLPHRGHRRRSCRSPVPASSSSARCGTGSPRRRSGSTHSTGWSPTSTSRESTKEHPVRGSRAMGWQGCACTPRAPSPSSCCWGSAHHI